MSLVTKTQFVHLCQALSHEIKHIEFRAVKLDISLKTKV